MSTLHDTTRTGNRDSGGAAPRIQVSPVPMLARPLDMVFGPPDPASVRLPLNGQGRGVWLTPGGRWADVGVWVVNPGEPGEPELLPWKRPPV